MDILLVLLICALLGFALTRLIGNGAAGNGRG